MRAPFARGHDHGRTGDALIQIEPTADPARQILVQHYASFDRCTPDVRATAPLRRFAWTRAGVASLDDPATADSR
jgi:hypothetical protein